jgi:general stress protein YciG
MDEQPEKESGDISVREAGRRGGNKVKEMHGSAFFSAIGKKGGAATRERHGKKFYQAIGRKGGDSMIQKHGAKLLGKIDPELTSEEKKP